MNYINKKHFFVIISVMIFSISIQAQDLIVTNEGDSLNCKISKIKGDNMYFTFKYKDEIRSTLLPLVQVKFHQYNYYQISEVPADNVVGNEIYPHIRVAINGGWSYRVAKLADNIPSDFKQYMKGLKSGYHYGLDLSYFFSEQLGFGLKYYNYKSKDEINNVYVTPPGGPTQYGKMSDNISINFIGPIFSTRLLNADKKNSFLFNLGIGYMGYKDKAVLISDYTLKGNTLGLCWDIGYDIGLSENFAIGFQFSYMIGTLTQYKFSDGVNTETIKLVNDNYESLSRIDLSIGLRFNK
jgi:hypothetical protein